jgi:hypothetical protein
VAETIDLPGIGPTKRTYVYIGGALVLVLGIEWYRNRSTSSTGSSTAAATSDQGTDPAGNVGTIDPATGYVEGSPEDLSSLDTQAGYATGDEGTTTGDTSATTGPPFTTNAAWSQYAINYLTQNENVDPGTVGQVLGAYLTGQAISAADKAMVDDAIAVAGYPPVSGANGYPPAINVSGSATGGTSGNTHPGVPQDLKITGVGPGSVNGTWKAPTNAGTPTGYYLYVAGKRVGSTTKTSGRWTIPKGKDTSVGVSAYNSHGESGRASQTVHAK